MEPAVFPDAVANAVAANAAANASMVRNAYTRSDIFVHAGSAHGPKGGLDVPASGTIQLPQDSLYDRIAHG